jgi:hypothetical protein
MYRGASSISTLSQLFSAPPWRGDPGNRPDLTPSNWPTPHLPPVATAVIRPVAGFFGGSAASVGPRTFARSSAKKGAGGRPAGSQVALFSAAFRSLGKDRKAGLTRPSDYARLLHPRRDGDVAFSARERDRHQYLTTGSPAAFASNAVKILTQIVALHIVPADPFHREVEAGLITTFGHKVEVLVGTVEHVDAIAGIGVEHLTSLILGEDADSNLV